MNLQSFLSRLNPVQPDPLQTIYGFILYTILLLSLLFLFRQRVPNQAIQLMMAAQLVLIIIDKVGVGTFPGAILKPRDIPTFFLRVAIFVIPLICSGMTRSPKSRPLGLMASGLAGVYLLVRGFTDFGFFQNLGIQLIDLLR